jgi:hypothetical protein
MLKCSTNLLYKDTKNLLTSYYIETGSFPDQSLYKSGDKTNPNNYRGICVTICIILNDRLSNFSYQQSVIHPSQIGFQSGHRTADHIIFLL